MGRKGLFLAVLLAVGACAAPTALDRRLEMHVLNRLAFGPNAESLASVQDRGVDDWIEEQLHPDDIPEPPVLAGRLTGLQTQRLDAVALFKAYGPPPAGAAPEEARMARERARIIMQEAQAARLMRAIESPRQLQEVMVDFWFNHFNVFAEKDFDYLWVGDYEDRAIRPFALGRFRDLLEATARHPAMLVYLDNWQNAGGGPSAPKGRQSGLNENYARELMELHTLGVDGGYTQDDVVALARILTGWGIARPPGNPPSEHGFVFDAKRHDFGDKIFLGHAIRGEGAVEVEHALDLLARSPATARHLSFELAQYFVADKPPPALVSRLTRVWLRSDGDIRAVLRDLFASPEFRSPANFGAKFKTPFQYVISALRAAGTDVTNVRPLVEAMSRQGQPLYGCLTPDGYKNTRDAWLNPDALALRIGFADALGAGRLPVEGEPPAPKPKPVDGGRLAAVLGPALSAKTASAAAAAPVALKSAMILGGPDFMTR
ncbi:DUF1800 domain-containing protein [Telmatospirillum siberiense]|uniref:DUF1800 domain-containing protein n=1 Tax=Telmatospirillum siberiense TaxID=382514 RepID=A0A2N3PP46_9PROT|nr:DUF1800 domain-containing protein [Telmatospirillum siberiense]PKU22172.1 DUF1800 domain-containing protein [Telmatospirillum siberiense]